MQNFTLTRGKQIDRVTDVTAIVGQYGLGDGGTQVAFTAGDSANCGQEFFIFRIFEEITARAGAQHFTNVMRIAVHAQGKDAGERARFGDSPRAFHAIPVRHSDVEHGHIRAHSDSISATASRPSPAVAWEQYTSSGQQVTETEKDLLTRAREVRSTMEYSYRRGEATLVEFLDAQRAFNDTVQSYNAARADYARSLYVIDAVMAAPR